MINYYNIKSYPFIGIIDPRTGEKLFQFNTTKTLDQMIFCEKITNFLTDYETPVKEEDQNGNCENDDVIKVDDEQDIVCISPNSKATPIHVSIAHFSSSFWNFL